MVMEDSLASRIRNARSVWFTARQIEASGAWLFWRAETGGQLRRSLERHGQLQPLLVDAKGPVPVLLAGAARQSCLAGLERDAWCLDVGALSDWDRGLVYLWSNAGREVTDGQVARALRYFHVLDPGRAREVVLELDPEPRSRRMRQALAWLGLPPAWDDLLDRGRLSLACAELLAKFEAHDLDALRPLFTPLAWSRGNAVNLLTWLGEIRARDRVGPAEALASCGVPQILDAGLSPRDAMARIVQEVRRRRSPHLSDLERNFDEAVHGAAAGTRWRITQPDAFESDTVEFTARLTTPDQVRQASRELAAIVSRGDLDRLFPLEER